MATNKPQQTPGSDNAADLVREKLARIFETDEPDVRKELAEAEIVPNRSKHQQFMYNLSTSGKNLAEVQTEWHNYYQSLPPNEKHQVWKEFYSSQSLITGQQQVQNTPQALSEHKHQAATTTNQKTARTKKDVRSSIRNKVSAGGKLEAKHHIQSLLFGLGMGVIALIIVLFGFFNEVVIAPFIQPSRTTAATPLIIGNETVAPSANPEIIIPKINVQIPVDYTQTNNTEATIQSALENGVVHYPSTALPGQNGNVAIFGHSSNNIFNRGNYKFAFVLLNSLVPGDTFYLTKDSKVYVYKIFSKQVVEPSQVGVLGPVPGYPATATLITCDPPGTSLKRLVVVGEQITPDPSKNTESGGSTVTATDSSSTELPGNGPTLFGRFLSSTIGKIVVAGILFIGFIFTVRWLNKGKKPIK